MSSALRRASVAGMRRARMMTSFAARVPPRLLREDPSGVSVPVWPVRRAVNSRTLAPPGAVQGARDDDHASIKPVRIWHVTTTCARRQVGSMSPWPTIAMVTTLKSNASNEPFPRALPVGWFVSGPSGHPLQGAADRRAAGGRPGPPACDVSCPTRLCPPQYGTGLFPGRWPWANLFWPFRPSIERALASTGWSIEKKARLVSESGWKA